MAHASPFYARLGAAIVDHPDLLHVYAGAPRTHLRPTTLLAAIHDVLIRDPSLPLARHFPDLADEPDPGPLDAPLLALFTSHADELARLVAVRNTQTNEVRRCAALAPALATIATDHAGGIALLELGTSAGLNLLVDRYGYRYGDAPPTVDATPLLEADVALGAPPPSDGLPLTLAGRLGLDLAPIDVTDPDEVRWLRACIWPEHDDRRALLDAALDLAVDDPPPVMTGDMVDDLADAVACLPDDATAVLLHCVSLVYLTRDDRDRFHDRCAELSRQRPLEVLALESRPLEPFDRLDPEPPIDELYGVVVRTRFVDGAPRRQLLARAHMHGRWVGWQA